MGNIFRVINFNGDIKISICKKANAVFKTNEYDEMENICIHEETINIFDLLKENEKLKKRLEYLKSGEYLNQLKFERSMLEEIVEHGEVSKEDKKFIDCVHRNTELLEENKELKEQNEFLMERENELQVLEIKQKEFIKWLEDGIQKVKNTEFLDERIQRAGLIAYNRCLRKYKKIVGDDK